MYTQSYRSVFFLAVTMTCLWLPSQAHAQFSFTLQPSSITAAPGTSDLTFSGTLANLGTTVLTNDEDPAFNLLSGPQGEDLTTFPVYLDNFYAPSSLAPGQIVGQVFSVNIDPSAMVGQYTGNIVFSYGGQYSGQDVTINAAPSAVPETSPFRNFAIGVSCLAIMLWYRRLRKVKL